VKNTQKHQKDKEEFVEDVGHVDSVPYLSWITFWITYATSSLMRFFVNTKNTRRIYAMKTECMRKSQKNEVDFEKIHALLREEKFHDVINFLINKRMRGLNKDFHIDRNHAWYCAGCAYFELGDFSAAKKAFLNAYRNNTSDVQCLIACGNCFSEMKKPKFAEKILKKALKKNPKGKNRAAIIYNLGNAFFDQGLYDSAINIYSLVIRRRDKIGSASRKNAIYARKLSRGSNVF